MSIYKGGYILADISDTQLSDEGLNDVLPQDLKNYILSLTKNGERSFTKEILLKPIKLLANVEGYIILFTFNFLSDDYSEIYSNCINDIIEYHLSLNTAGEIGLSIYTLQRQQ